MTPPGSRPTSGDDHARPVLAVVSGRPGAGKSTLARRIADVLACPVVSRDEINNGILCTLQPMSDQSTKEEAARVAFDAFFGVLALLVASRTTVIAEAAFQDKRWRTGLDPLLPVADVRVVHCVIDTELAVDRVIRRNQATKSDPVALAQAVGSCDIRPGSAVTRPFDMLSLPVPTLMVDTTAGYEPALDTIVAFVAARSYRSP
ncbi:MAG: AAA family ATPase [Pseudonocardia sp.]